MALDSCISCSKYSQFCISCEKSGCSTCAQGYYLFSTNEDGSFETCDPCTSKNLVVHQGRKFNNKAKFQKKGRGLFGKIDNIYASQERGILDYLLNINSLIEFMLNSNDVEFSF
jgi:hypothetical protein